MTAPDPILEVVAQALHGDECPDDPDYGDPCRCDPTSYDREAEVAVAAARPLIEAEVREAVARELDERGENMDKAANAAGDRGNYEAAIRMGGLADTYREAARIARNGCAE